MTLSQSTIGSFIHFYFLLTDTSQCDILALQYIASRCIEMKYKEVSEWKNG